MRTRSSTYGFLLALAVVAWLFAGSEILQRATIELHGKVVESTTSCVQPQNNRCATEYVVENERGLQRTYVAGPTDKALRRQLPVGTEIAKEKWSISYSVNGVAVHDFPIGFYVGQVIFGLCLVAVWRFLSKREA